MKDILTYIAEATKKEYPMKKKETYGEFGEKWFDKCKDFATAGSTNYSKYGINDFNGFLEEMDKWFKPGGEGRWKEDCETRWEMCKALKEGDLNKFIKIADDNYVEKFTFGAHPHANYVYGSYFLDVYMLLSIYKYIVDGNLIIRNNILNTIWRVDDTMDRWQDKFISTVHKLEHMVPGHK